MNLSLVISSIATGSSCDTSDGESGAAMSTVRSGYGLSCCTRLPEATIHCFGPIVMFQWCKGQWSFQAPISQPASEDEIFPT